jgi:hypothetical protein
MVIECNVGLTLFNSMLVVLEIQFFLLSHTASYFMSSQRMKAMST